MPRVHTETISMRICWANKTHLIALILLVALILLPALPAFAEETAGDTRALSARLKELGFLSTSASVDGETDLYYAVFNFQKANGIPASGIIDPTTSQSIMSEGAVSFSAYLEQYCRPAETDKEVDFRANSKNVKSLQKTLIELGYYTGEENGEYGIETACAVALFETVNGLEPDGIADNEVMKRLLSPSAIPLQGFEHMEVLSFGDRGVPVKYAQMQLQRLGYYPGECSGIFGESTRAAVISFEEHNGLEPTGNWSVRYSVMAYNHRATDLAGAELNEIKQSLAPGDSGYRVKEIKLKLTELGYYKGAIDESFDEKMRMSVLIFQEANGLEPTGTVDEAANLLLQSNGIVRIEEYETVCKTAPVSYGDQGYSVYLMTRRLQELGYPVETSWTYNDAVKSAVTVFQYGSGLEASDTVGSATRQMMNSPYALIYSAAKPVYDQVQHSLSRQQTLSDFLFLASSLVGKPYEAGKTGPESFGVGGFTYFVYSQLNVLMQPTAALQLDNARSMDGFSADVTAASPGSQLFFRNDSQLLTGIIAEEGSVIYASPDDGRVILKSLDELMSMYSIEGTIYYADVL